MKGIIALDIDGTITLPGQPLTPTVARYLSTLAPDWQFVFLTGRTFQFSHQALSCLQFPYILCVQNGATIIDMPAQTVLSKKYLTPAIIPVMQRICAGEPTDFVIYAGFEHQDLCYYRPDHFSILLRHYVLERAAAFGETWKAVDSFDALNLKEFPAVKCFGLHAPALAVSARIEQELGLHVPLIRDPYNDNYYVAQATHADVNKGSALKEVARRLNCAGPIIAAGDDNNDQCLFEAATITIAMATAPSHILAMADYVAPSAEQDGIIAGLKAALHG